MYAEQNRVFNYAVLASIVLHAMLLFGVSLRERARAPEPPLPLTARLVELPAPEPVAATAPQRVAPVKPRPRAKPLAPKPIAKTEPVMPPEPAPAAEATAPAPSPLPELAPAPQVEAPAAPPVVSAIERAPAAPPTPAEPMADPGSLEKYRHQLILAAPRFKRYPRVASDNNWQGFVALRMVVAPSGRVASLTVTKTSGYDVLDQQAMEMFRNAAAAVEVPPVLRGKQFAVEVGATYYFTD